MPFHDAQRPNGAQVHLSCLHMGSAAMSSCLLASSSPQDSVFVCIEGFEWKGRWRVSEVMMVRHACSNQSMRWGFTM